MVKNKRQVLGQWGETVAAEYLERLGFQVFERNVRTPYGEIDLLARKGTLTVFVEVKTRTTKLFGPPELAISFRKQSHLLASAQYYIQEHPELDGEWRIDAVSIQQNSKNQDPLITLFENVVSE